MSRVVDGRFILEAPEKEHFRDLMRECEQFCEVRVLTFCILGNHFHLVIEVPPRPSPLPGADQMLEKLSRLSSHQNVEALRQRLEAYRTSGDAAGEARELARLHARLWDLSAFMKLLKQRFSQWYNRRTGRRGTLWEGRFKSVLVEGMGEALVSTAGYVDLNPVRAGLVSDPKDYRWSGYGEAVAGNERAQAGLQFLARCLMRGEEASVVRSLELYRTEIFQRGSEEHEAVGEDGRPVRGALGREKVREVLRSKGRLSLAEYLQCRVRYFCDGAVFGSRGFVEEVFRKYRERFGARRRSGARRVRGLAGGEPLFTVRELRLNVFG